MKNIYNNLRISKINEKYCDNFQIINNTAENKPVERNDERKIKDENLM